MPSAEHEEFVGALSAGGAVLTPTQPPTDEELRSIRATEADAAVPVAEGLTTWRTLLNDVACLSVEPARANITAIYFHGGGYVFTRPADAFAAISALAIGCGVRVVAPDYRRAPESRFPAAVDDGVAVYRAILDDGLDPSWIVFAGDSAGAGLALACMLAVQHAGLPQPGAAVLFSPWTDLAVTGDSAKRTDDPVVDGAGLRMMAAAYLGDADPRDPLASPLYASDDELTRLAPVLIQVGTRESLLDDSRRLVERMRAAGVDPRYVEHEGVVHMWMVMAPHLPESRLAFDNAAEFLQSIYQST